MVEVIKLRTKQFAIDVIAFCNSLAIKKSLCDYYLSCS